MDFDTNRFRVFDTPLSAEDLELIERQQQAYAKSLTTLFQNSKVKVVNLAADFFWPDIVLKFNRRDTSYEASQSQIDEIRSRSFNEFLAGNPDVVFVTPALPQGASSPASRASAPNLLKVASMGDGDLSLAPFSSPSLSDSVVAARGTYIEAAMDRLAANDPSPQTREQKEKVANRKLFMTGPDTAAAQVSQALAKIRLEQPTLSAEASISRLKQEIEKKPHLHPSFQSRKAILNDMIANAIKVEVAKTDRTSKDLLIEVDLPTRADMPSEDIQTRMTIDLSFGSHKKLKVLHIHYLVDGQLIGEQVLQNKRGQAWEQIIRPINLPGSQSGNSCKSAFK